MADEWTVSMENDSAVMAWHQATENTPTESEIGVSVDSEPAYAFDRSAFFQAARDFEKAAQGDRHGVHVWVDETPEILRLKNRIAVVGLARGDIDITVMVANGTESQRDFFNAVEWAKLLQSRVTEGA